VVKAWDKGDLVEVMEVTVEEGVAMVVNMEVKVVLEDKEDLVVVMTEINAMEEEEEWEVTGWDREEVGMQPLLEGDPIKVWVKGDQTGSEIEIIEVMHAQHNNGLKRNASEQK